MSEIQKALDEVREYLSTMFWDPERDRPADAHRLTLELLRLLEDAK
jgi:hypothetical protein